jgi:hypothetical protein
VFDVDNFEISGVDFWGIFIRNFCPRRPRCPRLYANLDMNFQCAFHQQRASIEQPPVPMLSLSNELLQVIFEYLDPNFLTLPSS